MMKRLTLILVLPAYLAPIYLSPVYAMLETDPHAGHEQTMQSSTHENDLSPQTYSQVEADKVSQATVFKYVCPMHPQIVRDHEGVCPICGMQLVKQAFEQSESAPQIAVAQSNADGLKQGLAIRTNVVQKTTLWKYIPTFGKVVADESKVVHIHPRAAGWISDLAVRSNGELIEKGQLLYRLYSPEIVSAQQDLLLAIQSRQRLGKQANSLVTSAKVRLQLLGVSPSVIQQIERHNKTIHQVPIYAPQSGVVGDLAVQNGMYIQPQTELMSIADLMSVWVEADVLPLQQAWIKPGLSANITSESYPNQRWESRIDYIYPVADPKTQALRVRLPLMNHDEHLKPNMLMDVELYGGPKRQVLAIPLEAVIDDGVNKRVVRQTDSGQFEVLELTTGMETNGIVEVLSGLNEGDKIVVSGQFLIDSESQIKANLRRLMSSQSSNSDANKSPTAPMTSSHSSH